MKRRSFLRHTCHSLAIPGIMGTMGFSTERLNSFLRLANETDRVLVLIYLQGGNDGLNTVVPLDQLSALNTVRPHVILPQNKLLNLSGKQLALHPSLPGFKSLYDEGRLAIIQSVGYPEQNYSHFRSTDIWMSASDATVHVNSGWSGRYLSHFHPGFPEGYPNATYTDPLAIEIGYGSSLLFQGPTSGMSMVLNNPTAFYQLINNVEEDAPDTPAGEKLRHIRIIARQSQQYGQVVKKAADRVSQQQPYPQTELAQQLKVVSRLIAGGLKTPLYLVRLGNFDTHDAQVESSDHTKGEHATLLKQLNEAIMAFMKDLKFLGVDDRVTGLTFSEFGRRIVSNASLGTDHGSASPLFVFGNKVLGGVLGNNPIIPTNATYQNNLAMQFDFRQVYSSLLEQWFGVSERDRSGIMLKNFDSLPIIGDKVITDVRETKVDSSFKVYPNPLNGISSIEFLSDGKAFNLEVIDIQGRKISTIYSGTLAAGKQTLRWDSSSLATGRYFIVLHNNGRRQVRSAVKVN